MIEKISKIEKEPFSIGIKEALVVLTAYLYFSGWVYTFYLFKEFGLSLNAIEIPFYYFLMYSYTVLAGNIFLTFFVFVVFGYVFLLKGARGKYALLILLILLFPGVYFISKTTALETVYSIRSHEGGDYHEVKFFLKNNKSNKCEAKPKSLSFKELNEHWHLRLLTQNRNNFYAIYVPKMIHSQELPMAKVFIIPRNTVMRVENRIDRNMRSFFK